MGIRFDIKFAPYQAFHTVGQQLNHILASRHIRLAAAMGHYTEVHRPCADGYSFFSDELNG